MSPLQNTSGDGLKPTQLPEMSDEAKFNHFQGEAEFQSLQNKVSFTGFVVFFLANKNLAMYEPECTAIEIKSFGKISEKLVQDGLV